MIQHMICGRCKGNDVPMRRNPSYPSGVVAWATWQDVGITRYVEFICTGNPEHHLIVEEDGGE